MQQLMIPLEAKGERPFYTQIYEYIKEKMKAGEIPAYTRLPSTRKMSESLGVSRATVQKAYDQLLAEGYLDAEPCRGYYTAELENLTLMPHVLSKKSNENRKEGGKEREQTANHSYICDFTPSGVDPASFPYKTWRRLTKEVLADETGRIFQKGDPQGEESLRKAIASYIHESRGVLCDPSQILVGAGSEYLLMILSMLLGSEVPVAMEDPTYLQVYRVLNSLGHPIVPIAMDTMGIRVDLLRKQKVGLAYCMPSHQYPTGIVMPIQRRMELLKWAEETGSYLIEDDYDGEFRYEGRPIPSLHSIDRNGRVIYLGTFSRAIAPAIRISFLVLTKELLEKYQEKAGFYSCTVSRADQEILGRFLENGGFERHLNRMRGVYREKRKILLELLGELGPEYSVQGDAAGVHILIRSLGGLSEKEMVQKAEEASIKVYGVKGHRLTESEPNAYGEGVLLGFASLREEEMRKGAERLIEAWKRE